jgi:hypothetical protein
MSEPGFVGFLGFGGDSNVCFMLCVFAYFASLRELSEPGFIGFLGLLGIECIIIKLHLLRELGVYFPVSFVPKN